MIIILVALLAKNLVRRAYIYPRKRKISKSFIEKKLKIDCKKKKDTKPIWNFTGQLYFFFFFVKKKKGETGASQTRNTRHWQKVEEKQEAGSFFYEVIGGFLFSWRTASLLVRDCARLVVVVVLWKFSRRILRVSSYPGTVLLLAFRITTSCVCTSKIKKITK